MKGQATRFESKSGSKRIYEFHIVLRARRSTGTHLSGYPTNRELAGIVPGRKTARN
jgi:hypothetical protein